MNRIDFVDKCVPGVSKKKSGMLIGNYLVIGYIGSSHQELGIFSIITGRLFIKAKFQSMEHAQDVAGFLDAKYEQFMPILQDYPDADIIRLARWSVPDGLKIDQKIKEMEMQK
jgi:hypothetical protein